MLQKIENLENQLKAQNDAKAVPVDEFCDFVDDASFEYFIAYVRNKTINAYGFMDTQMLSRQSICRIKQQYIPAINYVICNAYSSEAPYNIIGNIWIPNSLTSFMTLYRNNIVDERIYFQFSYIIA